MVARDKKGAVAVCFFRSKKIANSILQKNIIIATGSGAGNNSDKFEGRI